MTSHGALYLDQLTDVFSQRILARIHPVAIHIFYLAAMIEAVPA